MQTKVNLSYDELVVLMQCIQNLNFSGKDVIKVGLLADKLMKEIVKIEQENQQKEVKK